MAPSRLSNGSPTALQRLSNGSPTALPRLPLTPPSHASLYRLSLQRLSLQRLSHQGVSSPERVAAHEFLRTHVVPTGAASFEDEEDAEEAAAEAAAAEMIQVRGPLERAVRESR